MLISWVVGPSPPPHPPAIYKGPNYSLHARPLPWVCLCALWFACYCVETGFGNCLWDEWFYYKHSSFHDSLEKIVVYDCFYWERFGAHKWPDKDICTYPSKNSQNLKHIWLWRRYRGWWHAICEVSDCMFIQLLLQSLYSDVPLYLLSHSNTQHAMVIRSWLWKTLFGLLG